MRMKQVSVSVLKTIRTPPLRSGVSAGFQSSDSPTFHALRGGGLNLPGGTPGPRTLASPSHTLVRAWVPASVVSSLPLVPLSAQHAAFSSVGTQRAK